MLDKKKMLEVACGIELLDVEHSILVILHVQPIHIPLVVLYSSNKMSRNHFQVIKNRTLFICVYMRRASSQSWTGLLNVC